MKTCLAVNLILNQALHDSKFHFCINRDQLCQLILFEGDAKDLRKATCVQ